MLDGIPYHLFQETQREGLFGYLYPTARMIAPFPSISNPSFARMFTDKKLPGYVRGYFNIQNNKKEENYGALTALVGAMSWERIVQYSDNNTLQKLGSFIFPLATTLREIDQLEEAFFRSEDPIFFGYIGGTDALAHMLGREKTKGFLTKLDARLKEILHKYEERTGRPLLLMLVSDHGNNMIPLKFRDWEAILAKKGFHYDEALHDDRSVVKVVEGFATVTTLHTAGRHDRELAESLIQDKAVDLITYRSGNKVVVLSKEGSAEIEHGKRGYRYHPFTGDPLNYAPLLQKLSAEGKVDQNGFIKDEDLFPITLNHQYPDALHRIYDGFFTLTENPPNLIVSLKDGYTSADKTLLRTLETVSGIYAHVEGSHGALLASHSNGIFTSNFMPFPDIRPEELRKYIDLSHFGIKAEKPVVNIALAQDVRYPEKGSVVSRPLPADKEFQIAYYLWFSPTYLSDY